MCMCVRVGGGGGGDGVCVCVGVCEIVWRWRTGSVCEYLHVYTQHFYATIISTHANNMQIRHCQLPGRGCW